MTEQGNPDREQEIEHFALRVANREIPRDQLLAEFKMLERRLQPRSRGPGRPAGAKTKAAGRGVKIARAFFYCEALGYNPTTSATIVSELLNSDLPTVFASMKRHAARVIAEVKDYCLANEGQLADGGFAKSNPEAYQVLIAAIMEPPTHSKEKSTTRAIARLSMRMARLIILEADKPAAKGSLL